MAGLSAALRQIAISQTRGTNMTDKPDEKTLILLMAIAELVGAKSDAQHINILYQRKAEQLKNRPPS